MKIRKFENKDMELLKAWLAEPHVARWYAPTEAWIDEVQARDTKYDFIKHFIVEEEGSPIGFCQYYDYEKGGENWNGSIPVKDTFSIDYLIGNRGYLGKGMGAQIVKLLVGQIANHTTAKRIIVQPERENERSRRALSSAGFCYDIANDLFYMDIQKSAE